jgi:hypothetical protein
MGSSLCLDLISSQWNGKKSHSDEKVLWGKTLDGIFGQKKHSPSSAPGPWGKTECLPLLHKTVAPE